MSTFSRYYCGICYNVWDVKCVPRLLKCNHQYCSPCLEKLLHKGQIICPEDMHITEVQTISQLPTCGIAQSVVPTNNQNNQNNLCSVHRLQFEYFCHIENTYVCSSCIKATHQKHRITPIAEMNTQVQRLKEELRLAEQSMINKHAAYRVNQQKSQGDVFRQIAQSKKIQSDIIQKRFSELMVTIRSLEAAILQQIAQISQKLDDDFRSSQLRIDQIRDQEYQSIQKQIQELLVSNGSTPNFFQKIQEVQALATAYEIPSSHKAVDCPIITFDEDLISQLPKLCSVTFQKKSKSPMPNLKIDQNKVSSDLIQTQKVESFRQPLAIRQDSIPQKSNSEIADSKIMDRSSKQSDQIKIYRKSKSPDPPFRLSQLSQSSIHKSVNKSTSEDQKTNKRPFNSSFMDDSLSRRSYSTQMAFETKTLSRVEGQLALGQSIEKLDLTNMDLYDKDLREVIKALRESSSHVDTIKLAKNKITDQGFQALIQCFTFKSTLHTINLTYNLCTEYSFHIIEQNKLKLKGKTIYLNNCKINANKYRAKLEELQKQGITVYL